MKSFMAHTWCTTDTSEIVAAIVLLFLCSLRPLSLFNCCITQFMHTECLGTSLSRREFPKKY